MTFEKNTDMSVSGIFEEYAFYKSVEEFDKHGNSVSYITYDKNDNILITRKPIYDENGKYSHHVAYDKNGNVILDVHYDNSRDDSQNHVREYDENGKLCLEKIYYEGELISHTEWKHNRNGRIEQIVWFKNGEIVGKNIFAYNEHGDLCLNTLYDENDDATLTIEYKYEYDEAGRTTHEKTYWNDILDKTTVYEYKENRVLIYSCDENENMTLNEAHTVDENGNIVLEERYANNKVVSSTEYRYDENGNKSCVIHTNC